VVDKIYCKILGAVNCIDREINPFAYDEMSIRENLLELPTIFLPPFSGSENV
jgi:hypothetical protein